MRKIDKIKAEKNLIALLPHYINRSMYDLDELKNSHWEEVAYERNYIIPLQIIKTTPYRAHLIKNILKKYLKKC